MTVVSSLQILQHPVPTSNDPPTDRRTAVARVPHRPTRISEVCRVVHGHLFSGIDLPPSRQCHVVYNPEVRVAGMVEEIVLAERLISRISEPHFLIYLHQSTIIRLPSNNVLLGEQGPPKHYDNLVNSERLGCNEPFAVNQRFS